MKYKVIGVPTTDAVINIVGVAKCGTAYFAARCYEVQKENPIIEFSKPLGMLGVLKVVIAIKKYKENGNAMV